jgi:DNA-binding transcriptional MocR family regulator
MAHEKKTVSCQNDDMTSSTRIGSHALAALLPDLTSSGARRGAVYAALADALSSLVLDGRIAVGTRVPSERALAAALGLSRTTVTAAYSALRADGYLISRTGSGSFTAVPAGTTASSSTARWAPPGESPDLIDLTCATPAGPAAAIADAVTAAAAHLPWLTAGTGYDPVGVPRLREAIAARFAARGVPTDASQILITNGALHALDLLLRLLAASGGRVLTELPTYSGAIDAIRTSAARLLPVPLAPGGGWDVEALQVALRQNAPGLAYLIPDFHNPTGALVPDAERRAVLRAARRAGTTVIVDETFVDLGFNNNAATPAAAIDPSVVTIGSLSKTVWGGLRIGWIRAQPDLVQRVAALRAATDMGGALLDQLIAVELVGRLDELAAARVAEVRPRRDALLAALARELPGWRVSAPQGGLSLWAELDAPLSTPLSVLARSAGVQIVPGSRFGADGTLERYLRLPYTQPAEALERAVTRLREVWTTLDRSSPAARPLVVA